MRLIYTLTLDDYIIIYSRKYSIILLELRKRIIYQDLQRVNINNLLDFYSTIDFLVDLL